MTDLESQFREFIIYYNTTMAHPFTWTYTGKPLQKQRRPHFVPPHRRVKMQGPHKPTSLALSFHFLYELLVLLDFSLDLVAVIPVVGKRGVDVGQRNLWES